MVDTHNKAGDFRLFKFQLTNIIEKKTPIEFKDAIYYFTIEESMNVGHLRGEAWIREPFDQIHLYPLKGEEIGVIEYEDFYKKKYKHRIFVYSIDKVTDTNDGQDVAAMYRLNFVSIDKFITESLSVQKSYKNIRIDDMVQDIFDEYYVGEKALEPPVTTRGPQWLVVPNFSPEQTMYFFSRKAVPEDPSQIQTIRWFENRNRFYFESMGNFNSGLATIYDSEGEPEPPGSLKLLYNSMNYQQYGSEKDGQLMLMQEIIEIEWSEHVNTIRDMVQGGYKRKTSEIDWMNKRYLQTRYDYLDEYPDYFLPDGTGGVDKPMHDKKPFVDTYMTEYDNTLVIKDYAEPGAIAGLGFVPGGGFPGTTGPYKPGKSVPMDNPATKGLQPWETAFLNGIAARESRGDYAVRQGTGNVFHDTTKPHPGVTPAPGGVSSATGRYQFIYGTWKEVNRGKNLPMTPENQDKAALQRARDRYAGFGQYGGRSRLPGGRAANPATLDEYMELHQNDPAKIDQLFAAMGLEWEAWSLQNARADSVATYFDTYEKEIGATGPGVTTGTPLEQAELPPVTDEEIVLSQDVVAEGQEATRNTPTGIGTNTTNTYIRPNPFYTDSYNGKSASAYHHVQHYTTFKIYGRNNITAGQVVELVIPKRDVRLLGNEVQSHEIDPEKSGLYLVESIKHIFDEAVYTCEVTASKSGLKKTGSSSSSGGNTTQSDAAGLGIPALNQIASKALETVSQVTSVLNRPGTKTIPNIVSKLEGPR